ncbi:MAG: type II toxin-antitoxin system HicB family antitoxin [Candidatus Anammoxibacter sp.]
MKYASFKDYVKEVLKTAEYKRDAKIGCVVSIVQVLPGCMTQGDTFEEARDNLIDAIELWITVGLRENENMPTVNGVKLAVSNEQLEQYTADRNLVHG